MIILEYLPIFCEYLAFIAAFIWCRDKTNRLFSFIPYLLYTAINETIASLLWDVYRTPNYFLYNIYTPIMLVFFCLHIGSWVRNRKTKLFMITLMVMALVFSCINIFFIEGFFNYNTLTNTMVSIVLIIICFIFLFDFLRFAETNSNPLNEETFWIVSGLLFFSMGGLIANVLFNYIRDQHFIIIGSRMYSFIFQILNLLLYGCFIIAFRLCYKNRKSTF